jgi:hypothetical protein
MIIQQWSCGIVTSPVDSLKNLLWLEFLISWCDRYRIHLPKAKESKACAAISSDGRQPLYALENLEQPIDFFDNLKFNRGPPAHTNNFISFSIGGSGNLLSAPICDFSDYKSTRKKKETESSRPKNRRRFGKCRTKAKVRNRKYGFWSVCRNPRTGTM